MVQSIVHELSQRTDYLPNMTVETIYLGGGTPSLLTDTELGRIFEIIYQKYNVNPEAEITLEANPEDISADKLKFYRSLGINRLSIGIQTFNREILLFLNRIHNEVQAIEAIKLAQDHGFSNITLDLIYALPKSSLESLEFDLNTATSLDVPHISAYCFTLEDKTVFGKWAKTGQIKRNEDHYETQQYQLLHEHLRIHAYEQYEISNFAREERYSKHNTGYWFGRPYLGIGPGAHSYNGVSRQWNISNNNLYIKNINSQKSYFETETLSAKDIFNEGMLTQLRTKWGVNCEDLDKASGINAFSEKKNEIDKLVSKGLITRFNSSLYLTEEGKMLGDGIVVQLMV